MISADDIKFYSLIGIFVIVVGLGIVSYSIKEDAPDKQEQKIEQQNYSNQANQQNTEQPTQPSQGGQINSTTSGAARFNLSIQNFSFQPGNLKIKVGDTVTWTNNDNAYHSIKFDTFSSATLNTGEIFSFNFTQAGTYNYSCGLHSSMRGQIVVE